MSGDIKVGLVQVNDGLDNQYYLPYSVGILQAYAKRYVQDVDRYTFLLPLYDRIRVDDAVDRLRDAEIVFLSVYVWNIGLSMAIAKRLKEVNPDVLIVVGGQQIPIRHGIEKFMVDHPYVDVACRGAGEKFFASVLDRVPVDAIPSAVFRKDGGIVVNPMGEPIRDLDSIPSPYLEGTFDPLMAAHPDLTWIATFETNRGCPWHCSFCSWGEGVGSKVSKFGMDRVMCELDWFGQRKIIYMTCADANFGILKRDADIARYMARTRATYGCPEAISIQNTKNVVDRVYEINSILADAGLNRGIVISVQSMNPGTLTAIGRNNISLSAFQEAQHRLAREGIRTVTDYILGLPLETYESVVAGVVSIMEGGQYNRIVFNNLTILTNSEMSDPDYLERYGMECVNVPAILRHGDIVEGREVPEYQTMVIATDTMPRSDWVRMQAFAWMVSLLYYDKAIAIPLTVLRHAYGISYRRMLDTFMDVDECAYPTLFEIKSLFLSHASRMQEGGPEFIASKDYLNLWWPLNEYVTIGLTRSEARAESFYSETKRVMQEVGTASSGSERVLTDAFGLNRALMKRPFRLSEEVVEISYNIWEYYRGIIENADVSLIPGTYRYRIDCGAEHWTSWDQWYREVMIWGNKGGNYLHRCTPA